MESRGWGDIPSRRNTEQRSPRGKERIRGWSCSNQFDWIPGLEEKRVKVRTPSQQKGSQGSGTERFSHKCSKTGRRTLELHWSDSSLGSVTY